MPLILALFAAVAASAVAREWRMQYFYDEDESALSITDLVFPSARRGIAIGLLNDNGDNKPVLLTTADGGDKWTLERFREPGLSLFFLDDSTGWLVTTRGLWKTEESGRSWKKVKSPAGVLRVYFRDAKRGWAVGLQKGVWETRDGGVTWTRVAAAAEPKANPDHTSYGWIEFSGLTGMIVGSSRPPRRSQSDLPDWMDPEAAARHREWPALTLLLQSTDGGEKWTPATTSIFGRVTRIRLNAPATGLALVEFGDSFQFPSEVYRVDLNKATTDRTYRAKDRAVTDVLPLGSGLLATIERPGSIRTPIPGKLKILEGRGRDLWSEMPVDYRAIARRAIFASAGEKQVWVATDTGIILKLAE